jgi:hypothetical protein
MRSEDRDAPPEAVEQAKTEILAQGGSIKREWTRVLIGFSARFPAAHVSVLEANDHVEHVGPNSRFSLRPRPDDGERSEAPPSGRDAAGSH